MDIYESHVILNVYIYIYIYIMYIIYIYIYIYIYVPSHKIGSHHGGIPQAWSHGRPLLHRWNWNPSGFSVETFL